MYVSALQRVRNDENYPVESLEKIFGNVKFPKTKLEDFLPIQIFPNVHRTSLKIDIKSGNYLNNRKRNIL